MLETSLIHAAERSQMVVADKIKVEIKRRLRKKRTLCRQLQ